MDSTTIINEIGGGLPAVVIVGLGWAYFNERRRSQAMADKYLDVVIANTNAMNALTNAIERSSK